MWKPLAVFVVCLLIADYGWWAMLNIAVRAFPKSIVVSDAFVAGCLIINGAIAAIVIPFLMATCRAKCIPVARESPASPLPIGTVVGPAKVVPGISTAPSHAASSRSLP